tara:strand:+ start:4028 stop:4315 length:288 start_codon:yes stop_codon:yes gene_type:complete
LLTLKCNNFGHLQEKVNDAITKINSQGDSSQFIKNLQKTLFFQNTSQFGLTKFNLTYFFLMVGTARFELATYGTQNRRATRLRYAPIQLSLYNQN